MTDRKEKVDMGRRRRRSEDMNGTRRRLYVDESKLDFDNFAYRFINNDPDRIRQMTEEDDWDIVIDRNNEIRETDGMGAGIEVDAGMTNDGLPSRVILVKKPLAYYNEDQADAQKNVDATETMIREGMSPTGDVNPQSYVPEEGIRLGRQE